METNYYLGFQVLGLYKDYYRGLIGFYSGYIGIMGVM